MAKIRVPKPPKSAFNPQRPASGLLKDQVRHLEWAVRHAGQRRGDFKIKPVKTEADVAKRMASLLPALQSADRLPFATSEIPDDDAPATSSAPRPRPKTRRAARKGPGRRKK